MRVGAARLNRLIKDVETKYAISFCNIPIEILSVLLSDSSTRAYKDRKEHEARQFAIVNPGMSDWAHNRQPERY